MDDPYRMSFDDAKSMLGTYWQKLTPHQKRNIEANPELIFSEEWDLVHGCALDREWDKQFAL